MRVHIAESYNDEQIAEDVADALRFLSNEYKAKIEFMFDEDNIEIEDFK